MNFLNLDNENLKNIILLYIDYNEIKEKNKVCAIENYYKKNNENYYLLNNDWFKYYLNINNLNNVYTYLITNNVIKKINNYNNLPLKQKIFMIFNYINKKELIDMKKNKNNNESLKEHKLFQLKYNRINNNSNKIINYMYDFLLLKEETYKLFTKNLNINYKTNQYFCYFDIEKILIVIKNQNQFTIESGHINDQNNFIIEILFDYNSSKDLEDNIIKIIDNGFLNIVNLLCCFLIMIMFLQFSIKVKILLDMHINIILIL